MSRIGLKYISPESLSFPAINGGKWNLASNFRGNFIRILSEAGVRKNDYDTILLFMKFVKGGMFLCAAKRRFLETVAKKSWETIWLFIPQGTVITASELVSAAEELVSMYEHPEAFTTPEAFEDMLSDIFHREFLEEKENVKCNEKGNEINPMHSSRIGYVNYEDIHELEIILSTGYKPQYDNFGLILLTDNPVRVEASLPRIYLPELTLHRQLQREKAIEAEREKIEVEQQENEESSDERSDDEETMENDAPVENNQIENKEEENNQETEPATPDSVITDDAVSKMEEEAGGNNSEEVEVSIEEPTELAIPDDANSSLEPPEQGINKNNHKDFSVRSFFFGFATATLLFLLIFMIRGCAH
ncbi:MAG: hypothetical protein K2M39_07965 [Muribaculaceae bacterium]|nr:hypothetical protein [Muribaculaceae bacterium]